MCSCLFHMLLSMLDAVAGPARLVEARGRPLRGVGNPSKPLTPVECRATLRDTCDRQASRHFATLRDTFGLQASRHFATLRDAFGNQTSRHVATLRDALQHFLPPGLATRRDTSRNCWQPNLATRRPPTATKCHQMKKKFTGVQ